MTNPQVEAPLLYARFRWPVIPLHSAGNGTCSCGKTGCSSPGKHPRTRNGLRDASTDREVIIGWWNKWPDANVGIVTGAASSLIALDIDPRHGGDESLQSLISHHSPLPETVTAETGGGGRHLLFAHPGHTIKNRGHLRPGVDVKGDGGYIVAPPSSHASGSNYRWQAGHAPEDLPLAAAPDWLLRLIRQLTSDGEELEGPTASGDDLDALFTRARQYVAKAAPVAEGRRNNAAFNLAGHLAAFQTLNGRRLTEPQILDLLRSWNAGNQPPLADEELEQVVASACRNGQPRNPHVVDSGPECRLPHVLLPGGSTRVVDAARELGRLLASQGKVFQRGDVVVSANNTDGTMALHPLKAAAMPSFFEQVAKLEKRAAKQKREPAICSEQTARLILESQDFRQQLPVIRAVAPCPVLIERRGNIVCVTGYDRHSGIFAGDQDIPDVPIDEAKHLILHEILGDFKFVSAGDRARAAAALITPALVFGGLLRGRPPVDLSEADASQAGKGFRNKVTAAVYGVRLAVVTQRKGRGVGSLEEAFDTQLVRGASLISFDNVRGKLDLPALESFVTEDHYSARIPYSPPMQIDPQRVVVMLTYNRMDVTPDFANRASVVRIQKQPDGFDFREFPEGDLLDHIRAHQPRYLGAIFSIVRAWHAAGQPVTATSDHAFRAWARRLDWICQNILALGPLLEGHRDAQVRAANPNINWLRDVALAVQRAGRVGEELRAHHLLDILNEDPETEVPGLGPEDDVDDQIARDKALRAVGRKLSPFFTGTDILLIDQFSIRRVDVSDDEHREVRKYVFSENPASPRMGPAYDPASNPETPAYPASSGTIYKDEIAIQQRAINTMRRPCGDGGEGLAESADTNDVTSTPHGDSVCGAHGGVMEGDGGQGDKQRVRFRL